MPVFPSIFSLTESQYVDLVISTLHKGKQHASRLYSDWFREGRFRTDLIEPQAQALAQEIIQSTDCTLPEVSQHYIEGNVSKFLLRFSDRLESESVIIPMKFGHTLCISSQVGCKMGCAFCETGKMGLIRHLTPAEIVSQVYIARFQHKAKIRNIVFMGMGEPFDNYDAIMQAIAVLTCEKGLSIAPSKITVSTSGRVDKIEQFSTQAHPAVRLAVSVNAPNDEIRNKLMPVNRTWNMEKLKEAMALYCQRGEKEILIEYVLIQGVNDSLEDAKQLADYLCGLNVKINLIPFNTQSKGRFMPPEEKEISAFCAFLRDKGYFTLLRMPKGRSIMAACGQLGNRHLRKVIAKDPFPLNQ